MNPLSKWTDGFAHPLHRQASAGLDGVSLLRQRGIILLAALGWVSLICISIIRARLGGAMTPVLLLGAAVNIGPTAMALRGRHDKEARAIAGTLAAIMPALLVYVLQGQDWQMDTHMYFFVALTTLTLLCDWRPIALASGLIAVHHLLFDWLEPNWVFQGGGDIGRVTVHVAAVVMQFFALAHVTSRLVRLLRSQDEAVATSIGLAAVAQEERQRADEALAVANEAAERAKRAHLQNRKLEEQHSEARRLELLAFANDFERSVAGIACTIEAASTQLESTAVHLDEMSSATEQEASNVAASATDASEEIRRVAEAISTLGKSIGSIASAAEQQSELTELGRSKGERSRETIGALKQGAQNIAEFIDEIRGIAAKTNLLALNATIEAVRAGDAGRGFVVVASEVKGLASDTARVSDRIIDILGRIGGLIEASAGDATMVNNALDEVAQAARCIAIETSDQRMLASAIEAGATLATAGANAIEIRMADLASSVAAAVTLSSGVRGSTTALTASARDLRESSERFVRQLRRETVEPIPSLAGAECVAEQGRKHQAG